MEGPSAHVLRVDFSSRPEQEPDISDRSHQMPPPSHLHDAAKRAWADVVEAANCPKDADERTIELAAVLLARLREDGVVASLAVWLNDLLIQLGLPAAARAEIQPEQALRAFARRRRARDIPRLVGAFDAAATGL